MADGAGDDAAAPAVAAAAAAGGRGDEGAACVADDPAAARTAALVFVQTATAWGGNEKAAQRVRGCVAEGGVELELQECGLRTVPPELYVALAETLERLDAHCNRELAELPDWITSCTSCVG